MDASQQIPTGLVTYEVPRIGTSIQAGADAILDLLVQDSEGADKQLSLFTRYHEKYRAQADLHRIEGDRKLTEAQRVIRELESRLFTLQFGKPNDGPPSPRSTEGGPGEIQQKPPNHTSATHTQPKKSWLQMHENLVRYNLFHFGPDALCFSGPWLDLWNEIGLGKPDSDALGPRHFFTPDDLKVLLVHCLNEIRNYKQTITSLRTSQPGLVVPVRQGPPVATTSGLQGSFAGPPTSTIGSDSDPNHTAILTTTLTSLHEPAGENTKGQN